ncbi:MAG: hypothetical protein IIA87_05650 [Nanoarchaeota archaeon]|nr:hypothetical protein [Nanoarchaeota archaeon]
MVRRKKRGLLNNFKRHWDLYIVFIFIFIRLILNLQLKTLSIFFAVVYLIFILMLVKKTSYFSTLFVIFLAIDSMIGTYLFTLMNNLNFEYYGTMITNLIIIFLIVKNIHGHFLK